MAKTKKTLQGKEQIDGKSSSPKAFSLDDILGNTSGNPFGTTDSKKFSRELANMSLADMQRLASKVGIIPKSNARSLKDMLMKEFTSRNLPKGYTNQGPVKLVGRKKDKEAALKILSQGR